MAVLVEAVRWKGDAETGLLELLEQRLLPLEETYLTYDCPIAAAGAITDMVVRGAPAIGLAAAYAAVLAAQPRNLARQSFEAALQVIADSRPTAVNLHWAVARVQRLVANRGLDAAALLEEARAIGREDIAANRAMGDFGAALVPGAGVRMLTYCNTGSLATAGYGTALGVIRSIHAQGRLARAFACETRPYLQGSRLTMWEMHREEIPCTLLTDNMVAAMMRAGEIDAVVVGADRVALNGDTANKIGTYGVAVIAKHHGIPFYVAAPISTLDLSMASGALIPIEERSAKEVTEVRGVAVAPPGISVRHPAFDVTPGELITGIITEQGVATAPYEVSLPAMKALA
jgi:methylthioribose-1-phosphate isomerase